MSLEDGLNWLIKNYPTPILVTDKDRDSGKKEDKREGKKGRPGRLVATPLHVVS